MADQRPVLNEEQLQVLADSILAKVRPDTTPREPILPPLKRGLQDQLEVNLAVLAKLDDPEGLQEAKHLLRKRNAILRAADKNPRVFEWLDQTKAVDSIKDDFPELASFLEKDAATSKKDESRKRMRSRSPVQQRPFRAGGASWNHAPQVVYLPQEDRRPAYVPQEPRQQVFPLDRAASSRYTTSSSRGPLPRDRSRDTCTLCGNTGHWRDQCKLHGSSK